MGGGWVCCELRERRGCGEFLVRAVLMMEEWEADEAVGAGGRWLGMGRVG